MNENAKKNCSMSERRRHFVTLFNEIAVAFIFHFSFPLNLTSLIIQIASHEWEILFSNASMSARVSERKSPYWVDYSQSQWCEVFLTAATLLRI